MCSAACISIKRGLVSQIDQAAAEACNCWQSSQVRKTTGAEHTLLLPFKDLDGCYNLMVNAAQCLKQIGPLSTIATMPLFKCILDTVVEEQQQHLAASSAAASALLSSCSLPQGVSVRTTTSMYCLCVCICAWVPDLLLHYGHQATALICTHGCSW